MTNIEKLNELKEKLKKIRLYGNIAGKLAFDMECCAPEESMESAGEQEAEIGQILHDMTHEARYEELIRELYEDSEGLTDVQKKMIEHLYEDYAKEKNVTKELDYEMSVAGSKAYADWLKAKKASDFSLFRDSFAKMIELGRKHIELRDEQKATIYDSMLDDFEKGGNIQQLDSFFAALKARIVPLLKRIQASKKVIRTDFLTKKCPIALQEQVSRYLLDIEGLRKTALVLMTTEHPFTDNYGPNDVRVTTHYYEDQFISNVFTTMHEGGHALFMQNEPEEFYAEYADNNMSNAMHECVSRFYENYVARSEGFIHFIYPKLCEICPDVMDGVSERELYEAANKAEAGLNRCDADELTYCLHVMIRYELEKAFVNGEITVDEIPALWNAKYKEYLGVDVPNDAEGCLQDVHWTGMYGYFPSYALGSAYGAQILAALKKELDFDKLMSEGKLDVVLDWFRKRVFSIASVTTPDEWIRSITGEPLDPDYFLSYLEDKYTKLYEL